MSEQSAQASFRFFSIYELREQFVNSGFNKQDLRCIACVSRALSDAALDALWAQQSTFDPLMRLLPGDAILSHDGKFASIISSKNLLISPHHV